MSSVIPAAAPEVAHDAPAKPDATQLALDRTRLAFERTTMAWVRTATSLITFGFTVYKFFQIERKGESAEHLIGPREFALMMISIGIFSLVIATVQHYHAMRSLKAHTVERLPRSLALLVGGLMSILGLLALTAVILRR
jgi:putative membrane protein